jgi:hypothetical protein
MKGASSQIIVVFELLKDLQKTVFSKFKIATLCIFFATPTTTTTTATTATTSE